MWDRLLDFFFLLKGKSRAYRLYERVKRYASLSPTVICLLHKADSGIPCPESIHYCGKKSTKSVVNFDAVKEIYCKNEKTKGSLPSVDAILYKGKRFLFVEIKSWQNFVRYQIKPKDSNADVKRKIYNQAKDFKLKPKVEKSMEICRNISKDDYLFDKIPVIYVLVTDVDTVADPLVRFRGRLSALAYKSAFIPIFNSASTTQLSKVGMEVRYVSCRQFDNFYDSL